MSENVATAERGFAAFSRGDWDACLAEVDPEIEWHLTFPLPDLPPDKTVFRGHAAVSGIEVDRVVFYIQDLRDAKMIRQRPFETEADAFAAAGVERD